MDGIEDEINRMTESMTADGDGEFVITDPPGTSTPGTNVPGTEAPSTSMPATSAPAAATDAPTTDAPSEMDSLRSELNALREEMATRTRPSTSAPGTTAPSTDAPINEEDFLTGIDLDDLTRDPDMFNKVLNTVMKKGIEIGRSYAKSDSDKILSSMPEMTRQNIEMITRLQRINEDFYKENADLIPFSKVVKLVCQEEIAKDQTRPYTDILKDVAPEVRRRLDLQKPAAQPAQSGPVKLPRKGNQPRQNQNEPEPTSLESELIEMNKALNS